MTLGSLAVNAFFVISGYLITLSWMRSRSVADFVAKRVLRIYPGYLVAFAASAAAGAACSADASAYLRSLFARNEEVLRAILFLEGNVLDRTSVAFLGNPFPRAVNGSMWTLQPELMCYGLVLAAGVLGGAARKSVLLGLLAVSYGLVVVNEIVLQGYGQGVSRLLNYFLVGAVSARFFVGQPTLFGAACAAAVLAAAAHVPHAFRLLFPAAGSYLILAAAYAPRRPGCRFFARTDLSYGIYLYSFPIQQVVVWVTGTRSAWALFAMALPVTLFAAWASWRFVEAPALARRSWFVGEAPRVAAVGVADVKKAEC